MIEDNIPDKDIMFVKRHRRLTLIVRDLTRKLIDRYLLIFCEMRSLLFHSVWIVAKGLAKDQTILTLDIVVTWGMLKHSVPLMIHISN